MTESEIHYKKMTESPIAPLIISLGIPAMISMLVTNIYNMADTYFVGTLGESQQAATGILYVLQAVIQALAFMIGQGSGTMMSKYLAAKDLKKADEYVSTGYFSGIFLGIIIMIFGFIFLNPMLRFLGSTETILPYARQYGFFVLIACPIMIASFVLNNNLRYEGKAFFAMIGFSAGAFINIFADWLFVIIFKWGVAGAGFATALSQVISFTVLTVFYQKKAISHIRFKSISRSLETHLTIMKIGYPALIRQGLASVAGGLLNNLTRPYGDGAIAAMSIVNKVSSFVMCAGLGISQGYQPVASFNYEAKKFKRVKKGLVFTMLASLVIIFIAGSPGIFFPEFIVGLFQKSQYVIDVGAPALRYACITLLTLSVSVPINMLYQSIRKPGLSAILSILRSGLMLIPVLLITVSLWGLFGIQISQPAADVLTALVSVPFVISFLKKDEDLMN